MRGNRGKSRSSGTTGSRKPTVLVFKDRSDVAPEITQRCRKTRETGSTGGDSSESGRGEWREGRRGKRGGPGAGELNPSLRPLWFAESRRSSANVAATFSAVAADPGRIYSVTPVGPLGRATCWAVPARRRTSSSMEPKVCSCRWIVMPRAVSSRLAV